MSDLVFDTADRLFRDAVDKDLLDRTEAGAFPEALWQAVEETGLVEAFADPDTGVADAAAVLRAAGRHAVPLPIAETLLARRLLQRAGLDIPAGPLALAPTDVNDRSAFAGGRLMGTFYSVGWASRATAIVALADGHVLVVDPARARIEPGRNLAGEPREIVTIDGPPLAAARAPIMPETLRREGAWSRSLLMLGAMETTLEVAATYANDRVQFGRPIGKQQSIQHQLALMAEEVAASAVAARLATERLDGDEAFLAVACAKIRCGEAAGKAAEYAHQVMGAIGFTHEHTLHHLTRRLWSWRDEYGRESDWSIELGQRVALVGANGLWPWLTRA
ncbi:acyl-CoA dehydrogenase [Stella humosa]|uniref:Acyl-CoA dehydrogenase n=1 Tax=Stella humosa TaxID=94 RepID=A0A3N1MFE7_9PROT|nr:acyl-CoA dehydrogenase family protein [Stella humosa]ROQ01865.1 acyl-CoA dehydrogenase [Stella humosa]BBK32254.1 acyl-CoA dehydrogenase [Stella humosa]